MRLLIAAGACLIAASGGVLAQGFPWPFGGESPKPPTPREPVYRPPAQTAPAPMAPAPGAQPVPAQPGAPTNWTQSRNPICIQLEQRLVQEGQRNPREQLPKLEADIRTAEKAFRSGESQLDQRCYKSVLFFRSLRSTRECRDLAKQVEDDKHRLSELTSQRQQILSSSSRSLQDDIIRELARNNCGPGYAQEARKRDGGGSGGSPVWQDEESGPSGGGGFGAALPYATYRTLCVRLCDGYYFPISFSTLPAHFQRDADACQSKCAAPVALYYHQNPGGAVDQMVAASTQEPYSKLKTAFRYRKEFVQGCSCKQAEYVPQTPAPAGALPDRRAEGFTAPTAAAAAGPLATRPR